MSPPATLDASTSRSTTRRAGSRPFGSVMAYLAAPLWALQAVIWLAAPKVQEALPPFAITKPLHFALFWLSIAGAVAFSAASAEDVSRTTRGVRPRTSWWATLLARVALGLATAATIATVAALVPAVQAVALSLMTNLLTGALIVLAASLSLSAYLSWRGGPASRRTRIPVSALAVAALAMIVAILASGSPSLVSLYLAVAVAALNGVAWFVWARASAHGGPR